MTFDLRVASIAAVAFCAAATTVAIDPSFALTGTAPLAQVVKTTASSLNGQSASLVPALAVEPQALLDDADAVTGRAPAASPVDAPIRTSPSSLRALVAAHAMPQALDRDLECLAGAVYFEAKSEPLEGQLAVAEVVINRAESGRFPGSICAVVFQPSQFSFVRRGALPPIARGSRDWAEAVAIATIAMKDQWESAASKAMFFHASRVSPNWRKTRVAQLGNHVFYR